MDDGSVKKGLITISFENMSAHDNELTIITDTGKAPKKLDIRKIKSYVIDKKTYMPKIIDVRLSNENHYLFVERLTDENARMNLYRVMPSENTTVSGEEPYYYFISFPSFAKYDVVDINSAKLVPLFDIKMSAYITDCPDLQGKIQDKEKNYYYTLMSLGGKRIEVIKNIVKEYNECK